MRIIKILFKNLNSLRGSFEIDFRAPEFASGIFAITGPTGAGKSTILDALCLSLYSQTPRLGEISKGSNEIMTRSEGDCAAKTYFEAGGRLYLAAFEQHRARKKPGAALQKKTHILKEVNPDLTEKEELARDSGVPAKVEEITHLSFKRFTKSMLLAQGSFASFLKADANERADILEQMTDSEIYSEISAFVYQKYREKSEQATELEAKLFGIELLTKEELAAIDNESQALNQTLHIKQTKLKELTGLLKRYETYEEAKEALARCEAERAALQEKMQEFKKEEQRLHLDAKARAVKPRHLEIEKKTLELQDKQKALRDLKDKLEKTSADKTQAENSCAKASESVKSAQKDSAALSDLSPKVSSLDTRLQSLAEDQKAAGLASARAQEELERHKSKLKGHEDDLLKARQSKEQAEAYLNEHQGDHKLESLIGQLNLIESQASGLEQQEIPKLKKTVKSASLKYGRELKASQQAEEETKALQEQISVLQESCNQKRAALQKLLGQDDLKALHLRLEQISNLKALASKLSDALARTQEDASNLKKLDEAIKEQTEGLEKLKAAFGQKSAELKSAQEQVDAQEEIVELKKTIARLTDLRAKLEDGKPCPLCGAVHHPYAQMTPGTDTEDELKLKELKKRAKLLDKQKNELEVQLNVAAAGLQKDQRSRESAQQEAQSHLQSYEEARLKLSSERSQAELGQSSLVFLDDENLSSKALDDYLSLLENAKRELQELLSRASELTGQIDEDTQKQDALQGTLAKANAASALAQESLRTAQSRHEQAQNDLTRADSQLQTARSRAHDLIAPFLKAPLKEVKELTLSLKVLKDRQEQYAAARDSLTQSSEQAGRIEAALEALKTHTAKLEDDAKTAQDRVAALKEEFSKVKEERTALFGEKDLKAELAKSALALTAAQEQLKDCEDLLSKLKALQSSLQGRIGEAGQAVKLDEAALEDLRKAFAEALRAQGFESTEQFLQALLEDKMREELMAGQEELKTRSLTLEGQHQERLKSFEESKADLDLDADAGALKSQASDLENEIQELNHRQGELRQRLKSHEEHSLRYEKESKILEEAKAELTRIGRLNALMGSADGKRYRRFVQGITLEYLAALANLELKKLTPRYDLIANTDEDNLTLDVIDLHMFNERRPTANLSGGETFLVSLALALGLSRLSGSNVQINSLFLDEGFGTLDDEALDSALNALSYLNRDGRTIGVISHVDKLKERIAAQIEVVPLSGGYSTLQGPGVTARRD